MVYHSELTEAAEQNKDCCHLLQFKTAESRDEELAEEPADYCISFIVSVNVIISQYF